jgi:hypothetical protein
MQGRGRFDIVSTAHHNGQAFPALMASCNIATPTVMLSRDLLEQEFRFPEEFQVGEDVILWIRIASRYKLAHLDRPLTIVRASTGSSAFQPEKQLLGLRNIINAVEGDPALRVHADELSKLKAALAVTERRAAESRL